MNDVSIHPTISQIPRTSPALLTEMMRSFTALARTLNLSQAVEELGSTRQTVRRHIDQLEEAMGFALFEVQQRRYFLTKNGENALKPAQALLDCSLVWYRGQFDHTGGMQNFSYKDESGWAYHQQQQPISVVWSCESRLLKAAMKAWTISEGLLESKNMLQVRPYILAYREISEGWICTEVGEKSFYSNWYGWAQARSSVGRTLGQFQGGTQLAALADGPFADISETHGIRFDQVMVETPAEKADPQNCVIFDRLLMGARMPDGSPVILSVVDRSCSVRINGLNNDVLQRVPARAKLDFPF